MGTNAASQPRTYASISKGDTREVIRENLGARQYNKAGAAEEHVVVRGEKNGDIITATRVSSQGLGVLAQGIPELEMDEHYNDPPTMMTDRNFASMMDCENDHGGDTSMHAYSAGVHGDVRF